MKTSKPKVTVSGMSPGVLALNPHLAGTRFDPAAVTAAVSQSGTAKLEIGNTKIKGCRVPNQTEQRMLDICEARKRKGEIDSYRFEGLTLKWGRDPETWAPMRYTPDVVVTVKDGYHDEKRAFDWVETTLIEVKGAHIYSRDLVRFKGCRAEWTEYRFEMWQWKQHEWTRIL